MLPRASVSHARILRAHRIRVKESPDFLAILAFHRPVGKYRGLMWSRIEIVLRILIVAAFVRCGIYGISKGISRRVAGAGPLNSIDGLLSEELDANQAAEQIIAALSTVGDHAQIAVLVPPDRVDDYSKMILPEIASITWPRPVYLIHSQAADVRTDLLALRERHFAAALIYNLYPPILPSNVQHIGRLTVVPIAPISP